MITCWTSRTISSHHIASVQGSSLEHHHLLHHNFLVTIKCQWSCIDQLYIPSKLTMLGWMNFFIKSISSENLWMSLRSVLVNVFTATNTDPFTPQISWKKQNAWQKNISFQNKSLWLSSVELFQNCLLQFLSCISVEICHNSSPNRY